LSTGNTPQKTPFPQILTTTDRATLSFLNGTTINMVMDGYYAYNFNDPIGRANLLRAYDVSSNAFSLNQADFIIEHAPDPANGKRFGARIDLQFGQATETLQGNTANEARPEIYRNIKPTLRPCIQMAAHSTPATSSVPFWLSQDAQSIYRTVAAFIAVRTRRSKNLHLPSTRLLRTASSCAKSCATTTRISHTFSPILWAT
jgi:Putative beta-barrel porin-2, OmpL-like. bbp2